MEYYNNTSSQRHTLAFPLSLVVGASREKINVERSQPATYALVKWLNFCGVTRSRNGSEVDMQAKCQFTGTAMRVVTNRQ